MSSWKAEGLCWVVPSETIVLLLCLKALWQIAACALQGHFSYCFQGGTVSSGLSTSLLPTRDCFCWTFGEESTNACRLGGSRSFLELHLHAPHQRQASQAGWVYLWERESKERKPITTAKGWVFFNFVFDIEKCIFFRKKVTYYFLSSHEKHEWISRSATPLTTQDCWYKPQGVRCILL